MNIPTAAADPSTAAADPSTPTADLSTTATDIDPFTATTGPSTAARAPAGTVTTGATALGATFASRVRDAAAGHFTVQKPLLEVG